MTKNFLLSLATVMIMAAIICSVGGCSKAGSDDPRHPGVKSPFKLGDIVQIKDAINKKLVGPKMVVSWFNNNPILPAFKTCDVYWVDEEGGIHRRRIGWELLEKVGEVSAEERAKP